MTFDFPNKVMYLKPGLRYREPDLTGIEGFSAYGVGDDLKVVSVFDHGPAAEAGLKLFDVLLKVDGQDISQKSVWEFRRLVAQPGKAVTLRIRRGEKEQDLRLKIPQPPGLSEAKSRNSINPR